LTIHEDGKAETFLFGCGDWH